MAPELHGVVLDAMNPAGCPSPEQLAALGARFVRLCARPDVQCMAYIQQLTQVGVEYALVLDAPAFPDEDWQTWAARYAASYRPALWVIGNEPDAVLTPEPNDASWEMDVTQYRVLWDACASGILAAQPDARLCVAGQMLWDGGWMRDLLADGPLLGAQAVDLHLYLMERDSQNVERARAAIAVTGAEAGLPVAVLEWTTPDESVVEMARMLRKETIASTWFAWSEGMAPGHGLLDGEGNPYPTFYALKAGLMDYGY